MVTMNFSGKHLRKTFKVGKVVSVAKDVPGRKSRGGFDGESPSKPLEVQVEKGDGRSR